MSWVHAGWRNPSSYGRCIGLEEILYAVCNFSLFTIIIEDIQIGMNNLHTVTWSLNNRKSRTITFVWEKLFSNRKSCLRPQNSVSHFSRPSWYHLSQVTMIRKTSCQVEWIVHSKSQKCSDPFHVLTSPPKYFKISPPPIIFYNEIPYFLKINLFVVGIINFFPTVWWTDSQFSNHQGGVTW